MLRSMTTQDPAAFFRTMLGEWEKMANRVGGDALKSEDWARSMNQASNATMTAQAALKSMTDRALAAANMPSKTEFDDLSARIGRIEETLARIEAAVSASGAAASDKPRPTRGRTPPKADV